MKSVVWVGTSLNDLRGFPEAVRKHVGLTLFRLQQVETPPDVKHLKGFRGVYEIRSNFDTDTFRTIYALKIRDMIYVLHAFKKKSKSGDSTPPRDIEILKKRLQAVRESMEDSP